MNRYYVNDGYFQSILNNYFEKKKWIYSKRKPELYHANFSSCKDCKITNNFIDTSSLGNKRSLISKLKNGSFKTYLLPFYTFNRRDYNKLEEHFDNKQYWIVKPEYGMRQEGILITNKYKELLDYISNTDKSGEYSKWIMQKYISDPLLVNGKKTHIRVYALLHKKYNSFSAYIYRKGYLYVADEKYIHSNYDNPAIHITSSCNNLECPKEFNKYFGPDTFQNKVFPQLANIVRDSVSVTYNSMMCPNKAVNNHSCYKFTAFDIILDGNFNAYLMEANARVIGMSSTDLPGNCKSATPSLQTPKFKKELMTEMMNIILNSGNHNNFKLVFNKKTNIKDSVIETFSDRKANDRTFIIVISFIVLLSVIMALIY